MLKTIWGLKKSPYISPIWFQQEKLQQMKKKKKHLHSSSNFIERGIFFPRMPCFWIEAVMGKWVCPQKE